MPIYLVQKHIREDWKIPTIVRDLTDTWKVEYSYGDTESNCFMLDDSDLGVPWNWTHTTKDVDNRPHILYGWSVYIKIKEQDSVKALEVGRDKIEAAMGLPPKEKQAPKFRQLVRLKKCQHT